MRTTSRLRLQRVNAGGEPAAMVATWVMGELMGFDGVGVSFEHPDVVTFDDESDEELQEIRNRVAALLREARFVHWVIEEG
jgi:hypothetical protein